MDWEQTMREKARGLLDAAFWNAAADEMQRLREEMERAAIACAHMEAQAARDILLKALFGAGLATPSQGDLS